MISDTLSCLYRRVARVHGALAMRLFMDPSERERRVLLALLNGVVRPLLDRIEEARVFFWNWERSGSP